MLLNKIVTNENLKAWGLSNNDKCSFCESTAETVSHLFYECICIQLIIEELRKISQLCGLSPHFSM